MGKPEEKHILNFLPKEIFEQYFSFRFQFDDVGGLSEKDLELLERAKTPSSEHVWSMSLVFSNTPIGKQKWARTPVSGRGTEYDSGLEFFNAVKPSTAPNKEKGIYYVSVGLSSFHGEIRLPGRTYAQYVADRLLK